MAMITNLLKGFVIVMFFNNRAVEAWNSLTNEVIMLPSVSIFRKRLYNVNFDSFLSVK